MGFIMIVMMLITLGIMLVEFSIIYFLALAIAFLGLKLTNNYSTSKKKNYLIAISSVVIISFIAAYVSYCNFTISSWTYHGSRSGKEISFWERYLGGKSAGLGSVFILKLIPSRPQPRKTVQPPQHPEQFQKK